MPLEPGTPSKLLPQDCFGMAGDMDSRSDSASLRLFAVTMMVGGVKVRSREVGFSSCFSSLEERTTQLGMGYGQRQDTKDKIEDRQRERLRVFVIRHSQSGFSEWQQLMRRCDLI